MHEVTGGVWTPVCQQWLSSGIWEHLGIMEKASDGFGTAAHLGHIPPFLPLLWSRVLPGKSPGSHSPTPELGEALGVGNIHQLPPPAQGLIQFHGQALMGVKNSELLRPPELGTSSEVTFLSPRPQGPWLSVSPPARRPQSPTSALQQDLNQHQRSLEGNSSRRRSPCQHFQAQILIPEIIILME